MYVITFANPKGGSGKTTAAVLLAEQIAGASPRVALLDCDPNQNVAIWARERKETGRATPFSVYGAPPRGRLLAAVAALAAEHDYLVIDLEGTADALAVEALSCTDLCVIPFEPTPMEARQAGRAIRLVHATSEEQGREIDYALLFTRANAAFQTKEERDIRTETRAVPLLPPLVRRAAYTRIFRDSSLLGELDPADVSNLRAAIENAHLYAQAVLARLTAVARATAREETAS